MTGGRSNFDGGSDEDGEEVTFEGTLSALQKGRMARARLRQKRAGELASRPVWCKRLSEGGGWSRAAGRGS